MSEETVPEIVGGKARGRWFSGETGGDFIEISFPGSKDTVIHSATPELQAEYRNEWLAYKDGQPLAPRSGTKLTELPNVNDHRALHYMNQQVTTVEELAALSDMQCQQVGHGTLTDRKAARDLLERRAYEKQQAHQKAMEKAMASAQPVSNTQSDEKLDKVIAGLDAVNQNILALVQALQPRKPGRPPKEPKPE